MRSYLLSFPESLFSERSLTPSRSLSENTWLLLLVIILHLPLVDVVALSEIENYLSYSVSLSALSCRIIEYMVCHWVVCEEDFKLLIYGLMQVKELGVCDVKDSLSVRLRQELLNLLVKISNTHEIFFFKLEIF